MYRMNWRPGGKSPHTAAMSGRNGANWCSDEAQRGERIAITRHGVPAALLVPTDRAEQKLTHKEIVEGMRALRKRVKPGKTSVREMVNEGRRF